MVHTTRRRCKGASGFISVREVSLRLFLSRPIIRVQLQNKIKNNRVPLRRVRKGKKQGRVHELEACARDQNKQVYRLRGEVLLRRRSFAGPSFRDPHSSVALLGVRRPRRAPLRHRRRSVRREAPLVPSDADDGALRQVREAVRALFHRGQSGASPLRNVPVDTEGRRRGGGCALPVTPGGEPGGDRAGRHREPARREHPPGRQHHHAAAGAQHVPLPRADDRAEGPRGGHRIPA